MLAELGICDTFCPKSLFLAKTKEKFRFFLEKPLTKHTSQCIIVYNDTETQVCVYI